MGTRRGRMAATLSVAIGLVVVTTASGMLAKPWLQERRWIQKLRTGDQREKEAAAKGLGEMRSVKAVPVLAELLRTEIGARDPELEWRAGRWEFDEEYCIAAWPAHNGAVYVKMHHSTLALVRIGAPAVPALADCLQHPNMLVRLQAAFALLAIGPEARSAMGALVRLLKEEEQACVLLHAVEVLGRIGPEANDVVPTLRRRAAGAGFINEYLSDVFSRVADKIEASGKNTPVPRRAVLPERP